MQDTRLSPEQLRDAALSRVPLRFQLREPGHPADGAVLLGLVLHEATVPARGDRPERRGWLILLQNPPPGGRAPTTLVALPGTLWHIEDSTIGRVAPVFGLEAEAEPPRPWMLRGTPTLPQLVDAAVVAMAEGFLVFARFGRRVEIRYGGQVPLSASIRGGAAAMTAAVASGQPVNLDLKMGGPAERRLIRPLAVVDGLLHAMDYPDLNPDAEPRWRSFTLSKISSPRWDVGGLPAWAEGDGYVDAERDPA